MTKSDLDLAQQFFLSRYSRGTRLLYETDLRIWTGWCDSHDVDPLHVKRAHLELFASWLQTHRKNSPRSVCRRLQTLRSFYHLATADDFIAKDPTVMLRMPRWSGRVPQPSSTTPAQVAKCLEVAKDMSPSHECLIALLAYLGLRVSEACSIRVEDFSKDPLGYLTVRVVRKGGDTHVMPIPVPLKRVLKKCRKGRSRGPLLRKASGKAQDRRGAYDWVKRVALRAGLPENVPPHSFRHGAAKMLLASGMRIEEVQHFMGHRDIRTTLHYAKQDYTLDQHGVHTAARIIASAR